MNQMTARHLLSGAPRGVLDGFDSQSDADRAAHRLRLAAACLGLNLVVRTRQAGGISFDDPDEWSVSWRPVDTDPAQV